jgi:hypothetical protein
MAEQVTSPEMAVLPRTGALLWPRRQVTVGVSQGEPAVPRRPTAARWRLLTAASALLISVSVLAVPTPTHAAWEDNVRTVSAAGTWKLAREAGVWLYGDSITVTDAPELATTLQDRGRVLAWDATSGIPTEPAVDRLVDRLQDSRPPAQLVMALGTNDSDARLVRAQVERVMTLVPTTTRVYWVNVWKHRWLVRGTDGDLRTAAAVNAVLDRADLSHPNLEVVDWFSTAQADPREYLRDGVHTLPSGRAARNALIAAALAS